MHSDPSLTTNHQPARLLDALELDARVELDELNASARLHASGEPKIKKCQGARLWKRTPPAMRTMSLAHRVWLNAVPPLLGQVDVRKLEQLDAGELEQLVQQLAPIRDSPELDAGEASAFAVLVCFRCGGIVEHTHAVYLPARRSDDQPAYWHCYHCGCDSRRVAELAQVLLEQVHAASSSSTRGAP